jgi:hypothetical protein
MWQYSLCFFGAAIVTAVCDVDGSLKPVTLMWVGLGVVILLFSAATAALHHGSPRRLQIR